MTDLKNKKMEYSKKEMNEYLYRINQVNSKHHKQRDIGGGKTTTFVPVDIQEQLVDDIFEGLWQDIDFKISQIENEVTGIYHGAYFHPVIKEWITVIGTASVAIQQRSKTEVNTFRENKIKNALEYGMPSLFAHAKSNARSQIGKSFGRGLNRKQDQKFNAGDSVSDTESIVKKLKNYDFNLNQLEIEIIKSDSQLFKLYHIQQRESKKQKSNE